MQCPFSSTFPYCVVSVYQYYKWFGSEGSYIHCLAHRCRESWQEEGLLCHGGCAYLTLIDTIIAEGLRAWAGTQTTHV